MAPVSHALDPERGIATLCFQRPEVLNAIDVATAQAFREAVEAIAGQPGVRCVVLRGAGRAFVAGGDLAAFAVDFDRAGAVVQALLDALEPAILGLRAMDAPVLGVVQGSVAGAGLSLMAACDLVLAAQGTRFVLAYDRIGAPPDCGGTWFLPRLIGPRRAAEMMLLSPTLDAEQALAYGLVTRVVAAEALDGEADALAQRLANGPSLAYGHYKRLADRAFERGLAEQMAAERRAFVACTATADFREGVGAFLARRPPRFQGG